MLILVMFLTGCATTGTKNIGEQTLIWCSHDKRPDWLTYEPQRDNENLFFVGLSGKFASEKEAREDALREAVNNAVKYIGIDVRSRFEKIQMSWGLSSEIMDPAVATREVEEHSSKALTRRVKAKEWYIEKYQRQKKGGLEEYCNAGVMAFVPKEEIDKSINERVKQKEELAKFVKPFGPGSENYDFNIKIWTDKEQNAVYTEGEKMTIHFQTEKDCYIYLFYKNAENNVTQLFPNSYTRDNFIKAGKEYSIPDETMEFKFTIRKPFGSEVAIAIASIQRLEELESMAEKEIFPVLGRLDNKRVGDVLRIISNIPENERSEDLAIIRTVAE